MLLTINNYSVIKDNTQAELFSGKDMKLSVDLSLKCYICKITKPPVCTGGFVIKTMKLKD